MICRCVLNVFLCVQCMCGIYCSVSVYWFRGTVLIGFQILIVHTPPIGYWILYWILDIIDSLMLVFSLLSHRYWILYTQGKSLLLKDLLSSIKALWTLYSLLSLLSRSLIKINTLSRLYLIALLTPYQNSGSLQESSDLSSHNQGPT